LPHNPPTAIIYTRNKEVLMSLQKMKVAELREVAEEFGVDLDGVTKKADIIAALAEEGVSEEVYANFIGAEHEELPTAPAVPAAKKIEGPEVVVKMERGNGTFEVLGYRFTREHPYVVMSAEDAQEIFDRERGFRQATPREAQEYYS
jgi:hypothetical protein